MGVKIVVIGAGVSGLTTALELSRKDPNYQITIVAKNIPGDIAADYTSPFAGANWHSFATHDEKQLQSYDTIAYKKLTALAKTDASCGITISKSHVYTTDYSLSKGQEDDPWFKDMVEQFAIIPKEELPANVGQGYLFQGMVITVPVYLHYLYGQCLARGIVIKRISPLHHINQALTLHHTGGKPDIVVNCSGLLAKHIQGYYDANRQFGVRGQVLHVRNNARKEFVVSAVDEYQENNNERLYIFPRKEGGCIIGGCFLKDYSHTDEDRELTKRILDLAIKYAPELIDTNYKNNPGSIDIIKVLVGQRPFREGGVRVEIDGDHPWLIHNYGIGGLGYQSSYGLSDKVCQLVDQALTLKSKL